MAGVAAPTHHGLPPPRSLFGGEYNTNYTMGMDMGMGMLSAYNNSLKSYV
jgi:hypothetical protein